MWDGLHHRTIYSFIDCLGSTRAARRWGPSRFVICICLCSGPFKGALQRQRNKKQNVCIGKKEMRAIKGHFKSNACNIEVLKREIKVMKMKHLKDHLKAAVSNACTLKELFVLLLCLFVLPVRSTLAAAAPLFWFWLRFTCSRWPEGSECFRRELIYPADNIWPWMFHWFADQLWGFKIDPLTQENFAEFRLQLWWTGSDLLQDVVFGAPGFPAGEPGSSAEWN